MATRRNMIDAMRWLVKDAQPHDSLFFHCKSTNMISRVAYVNAIDLDSGHGGQIPDTDGDEIDGFDEGKCALHPFGAPYQGF